MADEPIELLDGEGSAFVRRSSVGVLLGIMPWNYPYYQVARFAGPNLVIGNTILLKHAPQCPESAAAMEEIFHEAGFPADAYINIYATNEQIEWVIADPRLQGVSLTGSERAGAAVAEIAGRNLKKVVLELGGSDPFIVLGTDDLDATVESAVAGRLENTGQACNAAKRFIVVDDLYEPFVEKFTAKLTRGRARRPELGGRDDRAAVLGDRERPARGAGQAARSTAAPTLVFGGERDGNFFSTAVLTDIAEDNPAYREELFGPVASVYRVGSEEEAVDAGQRHAVRAGLVRLHHRRRPGAARRRPDRGRHGVRQRRRRRGRRAAVRRRQALRLRPRARPLRHRRVRQQEAHPRRRLAGSGASAATRPRTRTAARQEDWHHSRHGRRAARLPGLRAASGAGVFCDACGRNLSQVEQLPTRAEWERTASAGASEPGRWPSAAPRPPPRSWRRCTRRATPARPRRRCSAAP